MAFVIKATDANANPGTVIGRAADRIGIGGRPIAGVQKLHWGSYLIDLAATAYVTGGVPIPTAVCGFTRIYDMIILGGKDPYGSADVINQVKGITFSLVSTNPEVPLLKMDLLAAEVANAATQAAGSAVWVAFGGIR
jgi:hypothetical protein